MKRIALALSLALVASPAWANESNDGTEAVVSPPAVAELAPHARARAPRRGFLLLALAQIADCATTTSILARGGRELNPIARLLGVRSLPLCLSRAPGCRPHWLPLAGVRPSGNRFRGCRRDR